MTRFNAKLLRPKAKYGFWRDREAYSRPAAPVALSVEEVKDLGLYVEVE